MYHLDNVSGVPEMPEPKDTQSISPRWFGESQEQGGISWPGADWFNVVQAELLNLLEAAGIEPDKKSFDQLSRAIPVLGDAGLRTDLKGDDGAGLSGFKKNFPGCKTTTVFNELSTGLSLSPEHFRGADFASTDDELFAAMFAAIDGYADWPAGFGVVPGVIDLRGREYTLTQEHVCTKGINITDGVIRFNGGRIVFGELGSTSTITYAFKGLSLIYEGAVNYPYALIEVRTCFNVVLSASYINAGKSTYRARYGVFLGSRRGWGIAVPSGYYTGGECTVRVGKAGDHTGIFIGSGATIDHGRVCNLMLCNPAGFAITGANIEHSENGAPAIIITSNTNDSNNYAHSGVISGLYNYNVGNGSSGSAMAPAGLLIGHDAPGTLGWDVEGQLITSQNTALNIEVQNCYFVSDKQEYAIKLRGLGGLNVRNVTYIHNNADGVGILYEGTCSRCFATDNRNQNTGAYDEVGYKSSNIPMTGDLNGSWAPALSDSAGVGSYSRDTYGGRYVVSNGMCTISGWMTIKEVIAAATGTLQVMLPRAARLGSRAGNPVGVFNIAGSIPVNIGGSSTTVPTAMFPVIGHVLDGGNVMNLILSNGQRLPASAIVAGTDFRFSLSYPVIVPKNLS